MQEDNKCTFGNEKLKKHKVFINRKLINKDNLQFYRERTEKMVIFGNYQKQQEGDLPGGPVVKNLPSTARGAGSIPGWGDPTCLMAKKPKHRTEAIL